MDKYIEEFEDMSLYDFADELEEPLFTIKQNLTKTIYSHYAKERDKNYELETQLKKKQDVIEKAIVYAESSSFDVSTKDYGMLCVCNAIDVLDILKEVE